MVCSHLRYKPGKFCHLVQNLHIYDRHFDAVEEILSRESINLQPFISLPVNKNFYDIDIDDFIIGNIDGVMKLNSNLELGI